MRLTTITRLLALAAASALLCVTVPAAAQTPPACPVKATLKGPKTAKAGTLVAFKLTIQNAGRSPIPALNVQLALPDNVCVTKSAFNKPTTANQAAVVQQRAYWLAVPIDGRKSRSFRLRARVSPSYPTSTVPVSALVYALNATGSATCVSTPGLVQLAIKALPAAKASKLNARAKTGNTTCLGSPAVIGDPYSVYATGQRLLYGVPTSLTSGATPDACWQACTFELSLVAPFFFSITEPDGACFCSSSSATAYDPTATAYVSNYGNNTMSRCLITEDTGGISGCTNAGGEGMYNFPALLNVLGPRLYVVNQGVVAMCNIIATTGMLEPCVPAGLNHSSILGGIAFANGRAYVVVTYTPTVFVCNVDEVSGLLSACNSSSTLGGTFLVDVTLDVTGQRAYLSDDPGGIVVCDVDGSGSLVNCAFGAQGIPPFGFSTTGISDIVDGYIYTASLTGSSVTSCQVNSGTGTLGNCGPPIVLASQPYDMAIYNGRTYLTQVVDDAVLICTVNGATLTNCANGASGFNAPLGIVIYPK